MREREKFPKLASVVELPVEPLELFSDAPVDEEDTDPLGMTQREAHELIKAQRRVEETQYRVAETQRRRIDEEREVRGEFTPVIHRMEALLVLIGVCEVLQLIALAWMIIKIR